MCGAFEDDPEIWFSLSSVDCDKQSASKFLTSLNVEQVDEKHCQHYRRLKLPTQSDNGKYAAEIILQGHHFLSNRSSKSSKYIDSRLLFISVDLGSGSANTFAPNTLLSFGNRYKAQGSWPCNIWKKDKNVFPTCAHNLRLGFFLFFHCAPCNPKRAVASIPGYFHRQALTLLCICVSFYIDMILRTGHLALNLRIHYVMLFV